MENEQELTFTPNVNYDVCFVSAVVEIKGCFTQTKLNQNIPIAVFIPELQERVVEVYRRHTYQYVTSRSSVQNLHYQRQGCFVQV